MRFGGDRVRDTITRILEGVHQRYAGTMDGALAASIPELTLADPTHFGIALITANGSRDVAGDVDVPFTIQSVSKAFTSGMALDQWGAATVADALYLLGSGIPAPGLTSSAILAAPG